MHLFEAIDAIREKAIGMPLPGEANLWSGVLEQIRRNKYFDQRCGVPVEEIIRSLVHGLDDAKAIAMWRETDEGAADETDDEELVASCVRMDLEMELLQAIMNLAYEEAQDLTSQLLICAIRFFASAAHSVLPYLSTIRCR